MHRPRMIRLVDDSALSAPWALVGDDDAVILLLRRSADLTPAVLADVWAAARLLARAA